MNRKSARAADTQTTLSTTSSMLVIIARTELAEFAEETQQSDCNTIEHILEKKLVYNSCQTSCLSHSKITVVGATELANVFEIENEFCSF